MKQCISWSLASVHTDFGLCTFIRQYSFHRLRRVGTLPGLFRKAFAKIVVVLQSDLPVPWTQATILSFWPKNIVGRASEMFSESSYEIRVWYFVKVISISEEIFGAEHKFSWRNNNLLWVFRFCGMFFLVHLQEVQAPNACRITVVENKRWHRNHSKYQNLKPVQSTENLGNPHNEFHSGFANLLKTPSIERNLWWAQGVGSLAKTALSPQNKLKAQKQVSKSTNTAPKLTKDYCQTRIDALVSTGKFSTTAQSLYQLYHHRKQHSVPILSFRAEGALTVRGGVCGT